MLRKGLLAVFYWLEFWSCYSLCRNVSWGTSCLILVTAGNEKLDLKISGCIHFTHSLIHSFISFSYSVKVVECHCVRYSEGPKEHKTWCLPSRRSQNYWGYCTKRKEVNSKSWCVTRIIQKVHSAIEQCLLKEWPWAVHQHPLGACLRYSSWAPPQAHWIRSSVVGTQGSVF